MLCPDEMGILPLTNEWPESLMMADRSHIIMPSSSNSSATSSPDTAARHPTGPLKCPRCDSTNTKFCYYNNYSLAQPRHFCKACKRYWTRGGTLRNVPVGGGCRKNKRIKKTPTYTDSPTLTLPPPPISSNANFSNTADINPNFFYNLSNTISYPNLQQRVQEYYDLQPQTKASLGFGFGFGFTPTTEDQYPHHFRPNLTDSTAVSSAVKEYHYPLFGSSSATAASLLVSSLKQPRKIEDYQSLMNYNDQQLNGSLDLLLNQVKSEGEANNSFDWQLSCEAPFDAASAAATSAPVDSSFMYWNGAASGSWPEANYGSSITPLI